MADLDKLREHSFDGIQEYDNDLPRWWLWLFAITILVSIIYPFVYDFGPGQFASQTIDAEMDSVKKSQLSLAATQTSVTEESLLRMIADEKVLAEGKQIFAAKCFACHGDKGQGLVGPNLTDEFWIHGGKILDVHKVVTNGVLEKGMLAWKDQLTPEQINSVVAYLWTLYGSTPPNPKAPEGEKVQR